MKFKNEVLVPDLISADYSQHPGPLEGFGSSDMSHKWNWMQFSCLVSRASVPAGWELELYFLSFLCPLSPVLLSGPPLSAFSVVYGGIITAFWESYLVPLGMERDFWLSVQIQKHLRGTKEQIWQSIFLYFARKCFLSFYNFSYLRVNYLFNS